MKKLNELIEFQLALNEFYKRKNSQNPRVECILPDPYRIECNGKLFKKFFFSCSYPEYPLGLKWDGVKYEENGEMQFIPGDTDYFTIDGNYMIGQKTKYDLRLKDISNISR